MRVRVDKAGGNHIAAGIDTDAGGGVFGRVHAGNAVADDSDMGLARRFGRPVVDGSINDQHIIVPGWILRAMRAACC